jgi:hypothetical protein
MKYFVGKGGKKLLLSSSIGRNVTAKPRNGRVERKIIFHDGFYQTEKQVKNESK